MSPLKRMTLVTVFALASVGSSIFFAQTASAERLRTFWTNAWVTEGLAYQSLLGTHIVLKLGMTGCQLVAPYRTSWACDAKNNAIRMRVEYKQTGQCQPDIRTSKSFRVPLITKCGSDAWLIDKVIVVDDLNDSEGKVFKF